MRYFDTSVIVAALTIEAATNRAQAEMADAAAGRLAISDWTLTEVASALAIKLRAGQITAAERAQHQAAFNRFVERSFIVLPVAASHFRSAAMLSRDDRVALRAGDALHLAIAADSGVTVLTLDQAMAAAAAVFGIPAMLI